MASLTILCSVFCPLIETADRKEHGEGIVETTMDGWGARGSSILSVFLFLLNKLSLSVVSKYNRLVNPKRGFLFFDVSA